MEACLKKTNKNWPFIRLDGRPAIRHQVKNAMAIAGELIEFRRSGQEEWLEGTVVKVSFIGNSRIMEVESNAP